MNRLNGNGGNSGDDGVVFVEDAPVSGGQAQAGQTQQPTNEEPAKFRAASMAAAQRGAATQAPPQQRMQYQPARVHYAREMPRTQPQQQPIRYVPQQMHGADPVWTLPRLAILLGAGVAAGAAITWFLTRDKK